jgi:hypothetical protein
MAKPAKEVLLDPLPRRPWRTVEREPERVNAVVLGAHLCMTRQNVARLTAEGILERTSAGYLMDDSRWRYIRHLREEYRKSPRASADADLQRHKARLLEMKVARQERETILVSEHEEFLDDVLGLTLTHLGGWPARISGPDLALRRKAEILINELRTDIANHCQRLADELERNEPK